MNTPRAFFTAVPSSNCSSIYVIGGINSKSPKGLSLVERYDVMANSWETLAPMK